MELHTGEEESKTKSNPKSNDEAGSGEGEEEDNTSIGRAIAGIKKDLFKVDGTSGNYIQREASKKDFFVQHKERSRPKGLNNSTIR